MQEISTLDFSTPSFNPGLLTPTPKETFKPKTFKPLNLSCPKSTLFNERLFNHKLSTINLVKGLKGFKSKSLGFNPIGTGIFWVSHEPGGGAHISPPFYFSPGASEKLILNMTFVTIFLRIILRCITFL